MDGLNDEGDRVDDGGRVADVVAEGWGTRGGLGERPLEHGQRIERLRYCVRSDNLGGSAVWSQAGWGLVRTENPWMVLLLHILHGAILRAFSEVLIVGGG